MNYLVTEMSVYLLIVGLMGVVIGWFFRGECKDKVVNENDIANPKESSEKEDVEKEISEPRNGTQPEILTQPREGKKDNLSLIKGVGNVLETRLNDLGIYHFEQIALWDIEQQLWVSIQISFPGKVKREDWVKQAKELIKNS